MTVTIKTPEEQDKMRIAGRLAADVLDMIGDYVKPGITTGELDQI
jgi:methionyl aminopeptidase